MFSKIQFHFVIERWKFNENYQVWVSTEGRVRDKYKNPCRVKTTNSGYLKVQLSEEDPHFCSIHRLVLKTWNPVEGMNALTIDHLNHNKRDNRLKNLEWCTEAENQRRALADYLKESLPCEENETISHSWICQKTLDRVDGSPIQRNQKIYFKNALFEGSFPDIWIASETVWRAYNQEKGSQKVNQVFGQLIAAIEQKTKYHDLYWYVD